MNRAIENLAQLAQQAEVENVVAGVGKAGGAVDSALDHVQRKAGNPKASMSWHAALTG